MSQVSVRFHLSDLQSLLVLAKVDYNSAGEQIRRAVEEYVKKRKPELRLVKNRRNNGGI